MCENDVEGVKRSLNSFNCYSCYSCRKGRKITLCTQYRYIQCYVKRVERSFNSLNCYSCYSCWKGWKITLCTQYRYIQCYVKRVKRLCYVETRDIHIFAHNFLNIQWNFNPKKSFGKLRFQPYHPMLCMSNTYIHMYTYYKKAFQSNANCQSEQI